MHAKVSSHKVLWAALKQALPHGIAVICVAMVGGFYWYGARYSAFKSASSASTKRTGLAGIRKAAPTLIAFD